jgi:hypothetical protein
MELQAEELRVGNWYYHEPTNDFEQVNRFTFDLINRNPHLYHSIKLTEEWVIKFGFERTSSNGNGFILGKLRIEKRLDTNNAFQTWWNSWYLVDVTEVHNLQNLYFSLTGEELTIKE